MGEEREERNGVFGGLLGGVFGRKYVGLLALEGLWGSSARDNKALMMRPDFFHEKCRNEKGKCRARGGDSAWKEIRISYPEVI